VEIEQVLDAPPSRSRWFLDDSVVYTKEGTLLLLSNLAANVFILQGEEWRPLIKKYRTPEYNLFQNPEVEWWSYYSELVNSKTPDEYLFLVEQRPLPQENYRIFTDSSGEIRAEWVSREYYESHRDGWNLGRPWDSATRINLRNRIRLMLPRDKDGAQLIYPEIVDAKGEALFRVTDHFRQGFVEDFSSITVNPDLDRVAMVVSFKPEKTSPYYTPEMPRPKKLVILKIDYDKEMEEKPSTPLSKESEKKPEVVSKTPSAKPEWWPPGYVSDDNVRLRKAPNLKGTVVQLLKYGEKVVVLEMDPTPMNIGEFTANWYKVETEKGEVGWMYGQYLRWTPYPPPIEDEKKPNPEPEGRGAIEDRLHAKGQKRA